MKWLSAAAFAGVLFAQSASAQQVINLTVAAGQPPAAIPALALMNTFFIPEVDKRIEKAGLKYKIQWREAYAGSLIQPFQMLDGIRNGIADIGYIPTLFFPDRLPLTNITFAMPFVSDDPTIIGTAMRKLIDENKEFTAEYDRFNQIPLAGHAYDPFFLIAKFQAPKPEDVNGRKIGGAGASLSWVAGLGAAPVSSNMMEYYSSTSTGVYEGFVVSASSYLGFKYPEVAPNINKIGFGAHYAVVLTMNKGSFGRLPKEIQTIIQEVSREWGSKSDAALKEAGLKGLQGSVEKYNAKIVEISPEEQKRFAAKMPDGRRDWVASVKKTGIDGDAMIKKYIDAAVAAGAKPARDWTK